MTFVGERDGTFTRERWHLQGNMRDIHKRQIRDSHKGERKVHSWERNKEYLWGRDKGHSWGRDKEHSRGREKRHSRGRDEWHVWGKDIITIYAWKWQNWNITPRGDIVTHDTRQDHTEWRNSTYRVTHHNTSLHCHHYRNFHYMYMVHQTRRATSVQ